MDVSGYFKFLMDVSGYFKSLINIGGYFKSLINISGYLVSVKFSRIIRLVKFSKFLRYRVDINRNLRRIDLSKFPKFQFRVRVIYYRVFLFIIRSGK